jgi:alkylation response protein AidB-like acyl-CoA dehydrogenase
MNFDLNDDQHEIRRTARDLLAKRSTFAAVREAAEGGRYDDALWSELVELGWPGIAIAEEHGGGGLGMVELAILLEETGYVLAGAPLLAGAAAALVLQEAGSDEQKAQWLPRLASGEVTGTVGFGAGLVPDAEDADVLVLVDEDFTGRLVERSAADVTPAGAIDPTRRYGRVSADGGEPLLGDVRPGLQRVAIGVSAELVGLSQRALDMTVSYVKERKQFDTPVGAFQAVAHKCAEMLLATEGARSATYFAAWAADADPSRLQEGAYLAKISASEAGRDVTASAIQAHGGIGFTWEADVHWLYKRAQLDAAYLGGAGGLRARLAALVGERTAGAAA